MRIYFIPLIFVSLSLRVEGAGDCKFVSGGLLPYGPGDTLLPKSEDVYQVVDFPVKLFNKKYEQLYILENGGVAFVEPVTTFTPDCTTSQGTPRIDVFWADGDTTIAGDIYYRKSSQTPATTAKVKAAFPDFRGSLDSCLVVTWAGIGFLQDDSLNCPNNNLRNTFQLTLCTTSKRTYAVFSYKDLKWTTPGALDGNCQGTGGSPAQIGFDSGTQYYPIVGSCGGGVINVAKGTNFGPSGEFVYRLDDLKTANIHIPLTISPSVVSIFGHQIVTIGGSLPPLPTDTKNIRVKFSLPTGQEYERDGEVGTGGTVRVVLPYLNILGRLDVTLTYTTGDSGNRLQYFGRIWTTRTPDDQIIETTVKIPPGGSSDPVITLRWDSKKFGDAPTKLNLNLLTFDDHEIEDGPTLITVDNSGRFSGPIPISYSPDSIYILQLIPAGKVGDRPSNYVPSLFSETLYLTSGDVSEEKERCTEKIEEPKETPPPVVKCPPTLSKVKQDKSFSEVPKDKYYPTAEHVYVQSVPQGVNGPGTVCAYKGGKIFKSEIAAVSPNAVHGLDDHHLEDQRPYLHCCASNDTSASCIKFVEKQQVPQPESYVPPKLGVCYGDPHCTNINGEKFDYQGVGEFFYVKHSTFTLQARQVKVELPIDGAPSAAVIRELVFHQNSADSGTTLQLTPSKDGIVVSLDGTVLQVSKYPVRFNQPGVYISLNAPASLTVSFSSGLSADVALQDSNRNMNLNIQIRDGSPLLKSWGVLTSPVNKNPPSSSDQYAEFRTSVCDSKFIPRPDSSWGDYQELTFKPVPVNFKNVPADVVELCKGESDCLFDFVVTGSRQVATETLQAVIEFKVTLQELTDGLSQTREGDTLKIDCADKGKINILSSSYRRQIFGSSLNTPVEDSQCFSKNLRSKGIVQDVCEGENKCKVNVNNCLFGDACVPTYNSLAVEWECRK